jgi:hypothetical protein
VPIWSDDFLNTLNNDAIGQIAVDVNCIYARECLVTVAGTSVITLPAYVRTVRRVTWRGRSLDPVNWEELTLLTPATVFVSPGSPSNIETTLSRPLYYAMHPTNIYDIRLYPTPSESFTTSGEPNVYAPTPNSPSCIVDYYREPDDTETDPKVSLPPYIARRTKKAWICWKAFSAEGKGQNLRAASYYQMKYNFLIEQFRRINEGCFIAKKYTVDDGSLAIYGFRYPRPTLNPNFERTIF